MREKKEAPLKEEMALLELFQGISPEKIIVPSTKDQFLLATADLFDHEVVGFDSESKPVFNQGQASDGPHVIQLSTLDKTYIFQLYKTECIPFISELLESMSLTKIGFGLKSDRAHLHRKLGLTPKAMIDLDSFFRSEGYRKDLGIKTAIAVVLHKRFQKSKRISTSNWAKEQLTPAQLSYAANDAYAAIRVFHALKDLGKNPLISS
jgi:ribonuclease D